jgi:hypothetical protein
MMREQFTLHEKLQNQTGITLSVSCHIYYLVKHVHAGLLNNISDRFCWQCDIRNAVRSQLKVLYIIIIYVVISFI